MANAAVQSAGNGDDGERPPRLPRWTRQEILVLIQGKRVLESRGRERAAASEPKWAAVSAYCRRHGVNRGPVQCRKRWSNLAGDYKKVKEWEGGRPKAESFWVMRNDFRRERKLPGFFDREVFDLLDGTSPATTAGEVVVFDSGLSVADDGLSSDFEEEKEVAEEEENEDPGETQRSPPPVLVVAPISEKKTESFQQDVSNPGTLKDKQHAAADNPCKDRRERESQKRRRTFYKANKHSTSLQLQLMELLERNNKMIATQLEAQNINSKLDRQQRKDQADGLLGVLNKLADALVRIADKL